LSSGSFTTSRFIKSETRDSRNQHVEKSKIKAGDPFV